MGPCVVLYCLWIPGLYNVTHTRNWDTILGLPARALVSLIQQLNNIFVVGDTTAELRSPIRHSRVNLTLNPVESRLSQARFGNLLVISVVSL